jgi:hypothetical protein
MTASVNDGQTEIQKPQRLQRELRVGFSDRPLLSVLALPTGANDTEASTSGAGRPLDPTRTVCSLAALKSLSRAV